MGPLAFILISFFLKDQFVFRCFLLIRFILICWETFPRGRHVGPEHKFFLNGQFAFRCFFLIRLFKFLNFFIVFFIYLETFPRGRYVEPEHLLWLGTWNSSI